MEVRWIITSVAVLTASSSSSARARRAMIERLRVGVRRKIPKVRRAGRKRFISRTLFAAEAVSSPYRRV
ncbi:hypothetical protein D3C73_1234890 [compost metagenome]